MPEWSVGSVASMSGRLDELDTSLDRLDHPWCG